MMKLIELVAFVSIVSQWTWKASKYCDGCLAFWTTLVTQPIDWSHLGSAGKLMKRCSCFIPNGCRLQQYWITFHPLKLISFQSLNPFRTFHSIFQCITPNYPPGLTQLASDILKRKNLWENFLRNKWLFEREARAEKKLNFSGSMTMNFPCTPPGMFFVINFFSCCRIVSSCWFCLNGHDCSFRLKPVVLGHFADSLWMGKLRTPFFGPDCRSFCSDVFPNFRVCMIKKHKKLSRERK